MKLICIGRNYQAHTQELNHVPSERPVVFLKPDTAILLKGQPFFIPDFSDNVQHEIEVLVKINRVGKHISEKFAHKYYQQIALGIDFTARDLQQQLIAQGHPWECSKAFDGAAAIGRWVEKTKINDLDNMTFMLKKNGLPVQQGNTRDMLWNIDALIAYVSRFFTLKIGDILFTGTPAGVGKVSKNDVLTGYLESEESFSIKIK